MTLSDLKRMGKLISLATLSESLGYERTTLSARIRRGSPEITEDEARRITQVLWICGLAPAESYTRAE